MERSPREIDRRLRALEDAIDDVTRRLSCVERRVQDGEARASSPGPPPQSQSPPVSASGPLSASRPEPATAPASAPAVIPSRPTAIVSVQSPDELALGGAGGAGWLAVSQSGTLALAGRALIVLAGAFLLRAITEAGSVPRLGGVTMGFVYAIAWLAVADRVAPRNASSALVHGFTAMLVGLPLLWEASIRFHVLTPAASAGALGVVFVLGVAVAWHRDLPGLAAVTTIAVSIGLIALSVATGAPVWFGWLALALSVVTAGLRARQSWRWLQWPAAASGGLLVLALLARAASPTPLAPAGAVLALTLSCAIAWLGIGVARVLTGRVTGADWARAAFAVTAGAGGSLHVAALLGGRVHVAMAWIALLLAVGAYAIGLALADDRPHRRPATWFLTSQALVLVMIAAPVIFGATALAWWLALSAGLFSWLGARRYAPVLLAHGALYAVAAAVAAGLARSVADAWLLSIDAWPVLPAAIWPVTIAAAIGVFGPRLAAGGGGATLTAAARLVLGSVLAAMLGTSLVAAAGPVMISSLPAPGPLATLRSVVLAALAVALALAGRLLPRGQVLRRVAGITLVAGAVKLAIEDLWRSGPVLLFVALAAYGLALVVTSRLGRAAR